MTEHNPTYKQKWLALDDQSLTGELAERIRSLIGPITEASDPQSMSTPTAGFYVWRVTCPYCQLVMEAAGPHKPSVLLRHDLFNHIFTYHKADARGYS